VARLNFSHGDYSEHSAKLKNIRQCAKQIKNPITILQDLQGPRFRIGKVNDGIKINDGEKVVLINESKWPEFKNKNKNIKSIPIQCKTLSKSLKPGNIVLIEDGLISLKTTKILGEQIITKVTHGGVVKTNKGMNFPGADLKTSSLTKKDKLDVEWGIQNKVDFIAFSFVRSAADARELRRLISKLEDKRKNDNDFCKECPVKEWKSTCTQIIAKIETVQAIENFDEILEAVDGIMVARGDLGIEISPQQVPLLQKGIVDKCNMSGKPVIVATQMLNSMIDNPIPTRAEASDTANAILDGADAVMLSGESAMGKYPLKAVQVLSNIAHEVETALVGQEKDYFAIPTHCLKDTIESVSLAINHIAHQVNADAIVCATTSGFTPRAIARYKPSMPIVALTNVYKTKMQLNLSWGVESHLIPDNFCETFDMFIKKAIKFLKEKKMVKKGNKIIFAMDHPFSLVGETNVIKVHTVE